MGKNRIYKNNSIFSFSPILGAIIYIDKSDVEYETNADI